MRFTESIILISFLICYLILRGSFSTLRAIHEDLTRIEPIQERTFNQVATYPLISDTAKFTQELRVKFGLEVCKFSEVHNVERITYYKKVILYGSENEFIFLEYSYSNGCMVGYPWKYQILLTNTGELIKILSGVRFEFVPIFPNNNPFLLIVNSTSKGNGGHEIYRISDNSLNNVLGRFTSSFPKTYDASQDYDIDEPNELNIKFSDVDGDGFNDIVFTGKILYNKLFNDVEDKANNIEIPVTFIFLYNSSSGQFYEKEDYSKKYQDLIK
jgi:hypothetical protein